MGQAFAAAPADGVRSGEKQPVAASPAGSAGHVLDLIRRSAGLTRAEILDLTGLSRSTVAARLDALQLAGLVSSGQSTAARGRPPSHFYFRADQGALLIANAGATGVRAAFTDLNGFVLEERRESLDITVGPVAWLQSLLAIFDALLESTGRSRDFVRGIAIGVPGPVDFASATVVSPPIMTGWDGYPIRTWFAQHFSCPVLVDNDANAMTLGEHNANFADSDSLVTVKVATGIGAGIIAHGAIYRGADGAAGDIGHIPISPPDGEFGAAVPVCRCGNAGCLEAYAGGWALIRDLNGDGRQLRTVKDVVGLVVSGDPVAISLARRAGRLIGGAMSSVVSLLNPSVVVIGGELADSTPDLIAGIRERVYAHSAPLASRRLQVVPARLGDRSGIAGLAATLTDHIFDPRRIDAALA
ncbi:ROK family transcriptional regulator [Mycobacterium sp. Y57]|uniref:ROK family transcriptional regulator n=1 Tax=Mycolicibacterium xanthum TaxID=2796469 RepID=UPI001C86417B|nr:ROK family transcriptional regulator [Mycolicibacterium xanthum]MBX7431734.1 ROK family transcriptional regulator [Mycolicibacterium xanthum]